MGFVTVASRSELPDGSVLGVELDGVRLCLAHCEGEVYAFQDNCTHRDFPLSNGELDEECAITCEWHGARFDVRTGAVLTPPATWPVRVYACQFEGDEIQVDLERAPGD